MRAPFQQICKLRAVVDRGEQYARFGAQQSGIGVPTGREPFGETWPGHDSRPNAESETHSFAG